MRFVEEASNAMALDGIIFEGTQVIKVRRPTGYNPSLAATLGPSQPNPNLNLAAAGVLYPGSTGDGLEGKLTLLLWLMLANNSRTGGIPHELENYSSLLWLNLANNQLSRPISPQLARIGAISGECFAMKRWIPADYPSLSFVYQL
ncbi:hypothetical protein T459_15986 [Capsicum annuum]|uniref:Uncharacterized protein n=1 Tax=Capsicum annuum TaxID=4072 RepID=A0A2G2Z7J7_CAPAN|nr:hypothetical protein T459_15986 [Capsicum annuum]